MCYHMNSLKANLVFASVSDEETVDFLKNFQEKLLLAAELSSEEERGKVLAPVVNKLVWMAATKADFIISSPSLTDGAEINNFCKELIAAIAASRYAQLMSSVA